MEESVSGINDVKPTNQYFVCGKPIDLLEVPEWDVDSFDGLEYMSSSGSDEIFSHSRLAGSREDTKIYRRQIIESKGFEVDPNLDPTVQFKDICPVSLENGGYEYYGVYWEKMVDLCLKKHNEAKDSKVEFVRLVRSNHIGYPRAKSYITFMAREKTDGPLVEYQAKCLLTVDRKMHPMICRPAPTHPNLSS